MSTNERHNQNLITHMLVSKCFAMFLLPWKFGGLFVHSEMRDMFSLFHGNRSHFFCTLERVHICSTLYTKSLPLRNGNKPLWVRFLYFSDFLWLLFLIFPIFYGLPFLKFFNILIFFQKESAPFFQINLNIFPNCNIAIV